MKRRMQFFYVVLAGWLAIAALGCADPPPADQQAAGTPPPPVVVVETGDAAAPSAEDEDTDTVVAEVGFSDKGHYDSNDTSAWQSVRSSECRNNSR